MAGKPFARQFLFIFFATHLNPRIIHSRITNGEIAIHPKATKNISPIGCFILEFDVSCFRFVST